MKWKAKKRLSRCTGRFTRLVLRGARVSDDEIQGYIKPTTETEDSAPVLASPKKPNRYLAQGEKLRTDLEERSQKFRLSK